MTSIDISNPPTADEVPSPDQERLAQILDEYLVALEHGTPISPEDLLAQHPLEAEQLRGYLSGLQLFHAAAGVSTNSDVAKIAASIERPGQTIGDFRLLREIGRGGMGVVYEAWQLSLRRRVALKVLPFSSAHDAKHISRFKNEAQAAAQVQHPNIVPVFAVGEEAGIHYYAMQLIPGHSLTSMLGRLRGHVETTSLGTTAQDVTRAPLGQFDLLAGGITPRPAGRVDSGQLSAANTGAHVRAIARLGIQAADALHAAHEYGVVHRDIKPSNLLLDDNGKLWITDFGLARCRENSDLTRTGDILGTIRYMSPEQAQGRAALVDHRTDVYSLGVTLYELATLHHPAEGVSDAQLFFDRMRSSYKRPRQWNRHVPVDFDTIIMKSVAELPHERYATAQDLADDLRRFVEGKPILASPPSAWSRATKWAKRHRGAMAAAAAVFILAIAGLFTSQFLLARSNAEYKRALADSQRNLRQVRDIVDHIGATLSEQLKEIPGAEGVRRRLLDDTLGYYRDLAEKTSNDPSLLGDQAIAESKIGELSKELGNREHALESQLSGAAKLEKLVVAEPGNAEYVHNLALSYNNAGLLLADLGRTVEAVDTLNKAQSIAERQLAATGRSHQSQIDLATVYSNLGLVLSKTGARDEAAKKFHQAIAIEEPLAESASADESVARSLAVAYVNLGSLDEDSDPAAASQSYGRAIALQRKLVEGDKLNRVIQKELARTYNNLGLTSARQQDWTQAERCYDAAILLQKQLVSMAPLNLSYQGDLAVSHNNLGMVQSQLGQTSEAELSFREALEKQTKLLDAIPDDVQTLSYLGGVYNNLGMLYERQQHSAEAEVAYEQAIKFQRQAFDAAPKLESVRDLLSKHYFNYARVLRQRAKPAAAVDITLKRKSLWPADPERLFSVAQELAAACQSMSSASQSDRNAETNCTNAAIDTLREALVAGLPVERLQDASLAALAARQEFRQLLTDTRGSQSSPPKSRSELN